MSTTSDTNDPQEMLRKIVEEGQQRILASSAASRAELMKAMASLDVGVTVSKDSLDQDLLDAFNGAAGHAPTQQMILTMQSVRLLHRIEASILALADALTPVPEDAGTETGPVS